MKLPQLSALIAATPGAQPLVLALARIQERREKLLKQTVPPADDFTAAEPFSIVDAPDEFAKGFFQRLMAKETPPRGSKPRLVVTNDDDDPEPPKAA